MLTEYKKLVCLKLSTELKLKKMASKNEIKEIPKCFYYCLESKFQDDQTSKLTNVQISFKIDDLKSDNWKKTTELFE